MFFKDWRECSQDLIPLPLDKNKFYYMQAQAWHLKGYIGGTHSYSVAWSKDHNKFLVIELNDFETLGYQNCNIVYSGSESVDKSKHVACVTDRAYNAQWFGKNPYIVDSTSAVNYNDLLEVIKSYPLNEFKLLLQNCNTFTSYIHWRLNLEIKRPIRSVGYKNKTWWQEQYGS